MIGLFIFMNIATICNPKHVEFFQSTDFEILLYGGSNSGKSYSVVHKFATQILYQDMMLDKTLTMAIIRKSMPSLERTCLFILEKEFKRMHIPYKINRKTNTIKAGNNTTIFLISIMNSIELEKILSLTDIDIIWFEELDQMLEAAWSEGTRRVRGGKGLFKQVIGTFNPITVTSWVYNRFFIRNIGNVKKINVTIESNPYASKQEIAILDRLQHEDYNKYLVYRLGQWGQLTGAIYKNWTECTYESKPFEEIIYGLDFGYNNPSALIEAKIYDQDYFISEKIYKTGLTNNDLIELLKQEVKPDSIIYADCAEPARIEEIRKAGFNVKPAKKDVKNGIDFLKSQHIEYDAVSSNLIKEKDGYSWKIDKDGNPQDEPVKFMDHLIDAARYAIYTHGKHGGSDYVESVAIGGGEVW